MIYIKTNMTEMPKSCLGCPVNDENFDCLIAQENVFEFCLHNKPRPVWCPLVEIKENENDK